MCLAKPLKLVDIQSASATGTVDIDGGTLTVGIALVPDAKVGNYVLVHAGMAIELLEDEDAASILDAYEHYVVTGDQIDPGFVGVED